MRTTKRFTPRVLERFRAEGRGTGASESYIPWHRVSRGDPASAGRSHIINWRGRQRELLSDGEFIGFCFSTRLLGAGGDLREQFPLSLDTAPHESSAYNTRFAETMSPGTQEIAKQLGIRHPRVNGDGQSAPWVMTTDIVIMQPTRNENFRLLAVAVKDRRPLSKRALELLNIERTYWILRGSIWLLITPHQYHPLAAETLCRTWQWALLAPVAAAEVDAAVTVVHQCYGCGLTFMLQRLATELGNQDLAQRAIWQAIWSGRLPADLRRGWRPHLPLDLLPQEEFDALNPVLMERSAWI